MSPTAELTKKQQRLLEMIEDPRRRSYWAPRSRRRQAVVALAVTSMLSVTLFAPAILMTAPWSYLPFAGFLVMATLVLPLAARVSVASRCTPHQIGLDEFQRAEMDHASLLGHRVTNVGLVVLITVTSGMGGALTAMDFSASVAVAILLPLVFVTALCHATFPACYLAWTRPDEVLDDAEEPVEG